jgi:hypothetical protein
MDTPNERQFIENYEYYIENELNDRLYAILNRGININRIQRAIIEIKNYQMTYSTSILYTPLECAYKFKNIVAMELLLDFGFDPNMKHYSNENIEQTEFSSILRIMEFEIASGSDAFGAIYILLNLLIDYGADIDVAISHITKNSNNDSVAFRGALTHREVSNILLDMIHEIVEEHDTYKSKKMAAFAKSQNMISNILGQDMDPGLYSRISKHVNTLPGNEYYTRYDPDETYDMYRSKMFRQKHSKRKFAKRTKKKRKPKRF